MQKVSIGINGLGRIGKNILRTMHRRYPGKLEVVAINSLGNIDQMVHMLKYDSLYGPLEEKVGVSGGDILVGDKKIAFSSEKDPTKIGWGKKRVDIVVESTGVFRDADGAKAHLEGGAKKVIITAPAKDPDKTFVYGINHNEYKPNEHSIISAASCTTTCSATMCKVLDDAFGIEKAMVSTIHSYTSDQSLLDGLHSDPRRARTTAVSIIPTSTGAAQAVALVMPSLKGKLNGIAYRVPTPTVSVVDLTVKLKKGTTIAALNGAFEKAANGELKDVLSFVKEELVSIDYLGNPNSCSIDAPLTDCLGDDLFKVVGWYDNEWGYACRVGDLAHHIGKFL